MLDPLAFPFFVRALIASTVVGLVCAVVGSYMVLRGLAFMGDALSHAAFPGVVVAYLLQGPFYLGAAIAAVGTALAIGWVTRRGGLRGDTAIGVLFAGMFALGVFLFSRIPNYVGDLFGFLFGEVLGISDGDLIALSALAIGRARDRDDPLEGVALLDVRPARRGRRGPARRRLDYVFLALIALTIVVSLQAVGIILVVAMLVTPAAIGQLVASSFGRLVASPSRSASLAGPRAVPELLARRGQRGDDRARRDGGLPGRAPPQASTHRHACGWQAAVRLGAGASHEAPASEVHR